MDTDRNRTIIPVHDIPNFTEPILGLTYIQRDFFRLRISGLRSFTSTLIG